MPENCPICGDKSTVRSKLLLIDAAWQNFPIDDPRHIDARLAYFADLRVDDIATGVRERPLEQFLDGFYCDRCGHGFVSEQVLKESRRRYK